MANYTIIGGDGKQYGPITDTELRKWIAEDRLNAQSLAKSESDAEFRPLSTFPEFADAFGMPAPMPGMPPPLGVGQDGRQAALDKVRVPAIGLMVVSIINVVWSARDAISSLIRPPNVQQMMQQLDSEIEQMNNPQVEQFMHQFSQILRILYGPVMGVVTEVFQLIIAALILAGAIKMKSLKGYEFGLTAAILSVIPCLAGCCSWPLGLIFGIWAIQVLRRPEVKLHFT